MRFDAVARILSSMNVRDVRVAHLVGVGGINMAAVAKLLLAAGVRVSGSDIAENDETRALSQRGATIALGVGCSSRKDGRDESYTRMGSEQGGISAGLIRCTFRQASVRAREPGACAISPPSGG